MESTRICKLFQLTYTLPEEGPPIRLRGIVIRVTDVKAVGDGGCIRPLFLRLYPAT